MNDFFESIIYQPVRVMPTEIEYLETKILGPTFPWYYMNNQTFDNNSSLIPKKIRPYVSYVNPAYLSHQLLTRSVNESISHLERSHKDFSYYFEFFLEIFNRFMVDNSLKYKKIFRANLNLSWFHGTNKHTEPHLDHDWAHKNFIMYLNDCTQGQTIVWPDNFEFSYMVPCKKFHAVTFDAKKHAHRLPAAGEKRTVLVFTYN